mgnify:CR=1 FL=1
MQKTILITGGGRGIGAATARLLARQGHAICINYASNQTTAQAVVDEIQAAGGQAWCVAADVSQADQVQALFEFVDRECPPLHALVNNAGIVAPYARVEGMDLARLQRVFATNVMGSFLCAHAALARLSTRHGGAGGSIVNLSTAFVKTGAPGMAVDYAASKSAIETFTIGLAREVAAEGVRVNAVIDTDIHAAAGDPERANKAKDFVPMKRAGRAEEVAQAIAWLVSDAASYSTGAVVDVSGGV